jgi:hypothetical protein
MMTPGCPILQSASDWAAARRLGAQALVGGIDLILSACDLGVDETNDRAV